MILDNNTPISGNIELTNEATEQISLDAKKQGNWKSAQEMELIVEINSDAHKLGILLEDIPVSKNVRFQTISINDKNDL